MATELDSLSEIQKFILMELPSHQQDIAKVTGDRFNISRQAVGRHIRRLVQLGFLTAHGETRSRQYRFVVLGTNTVTVPITPQLAEDAVWREHVAPVLIGLPDNVVGICYHGMTEIVNNAIDHSGAESVVISVEYTAASIQIVVVDQGIGIFRKIKEYCNLEDERHAILELSKGKLTTDPARHTGEGIFFTSRMVDEFGILSGSLFVSCTRDGGDWLLEDRAYHLKGTSVSMKISPFSPHTTTEVFERYATDQDDYAFSRTHVLVALARQFQGEKLVSRSQAKRVMARLDRFKEVVLDFQNIDEVGPAFADEIFRVFRAEHPGTHVAAINFNEAVGRMIRRTVITVEPANLPLTGQPSIVKVEDKNQASE
jgi:anti-sigma regulatory factor (Ser/Thr protein kinase)/DNA-binding transcriptional ArsR family regulator